jgi:hypothetical protein
VHEFDVVYARHSSGYEVAMNFRCRFCGAQMNDLEKLA